MVNFNTLSQSFADANIENNNDNITAAQFQELAQELSEDLGLQLNDVNGLFGQSLVGLSRDQAFAMISDVLMSVDSNADEDGIQLEQGQTLAGTVATQLGVEENALGQRMTQISSVFKDIEIDIEGENTEDINDDVITYGGDDAKINELFTALNVQVENENNPNGTGSSDSTGNNTGQNN